MCWTSILICLNEISYDKWVEYDMRKKIQLRLRIFFKNTGNCNALIWRKKKLALQGYIIIQ